MIQAPFDRQEFLDEWEFVLDDSVYSSGNISDDSDEDAGYWWIVYDVNSSGESISNWKESTTLVKIFFKKANSDALDPREVSDIWYTFGRTSDALSVEDIDAKPNTIYKVLNSMGKPENKLYYIDHGWYSVNFPYKDKNGETDFSVCHAKVPVNGMINYRGSIIKKFWDVKE